MDLAKVLRVSRRWWWVITIGVVAGLVMASLSLFSVSYKRGDNPAWSYKRRSHTTYETKLNLLIDVPGFGAGRTDVSMDKPARMAPTFAYIAMSDDVMKRVTDEIGPLGKETKVVVEPVQDSPVLQIAVEGPDATWVRRVASTVGRATVEYITGEQNSNSVPTAYRLKISPLGTPSKPEALKSRDVEIAAILALLPIFLAFMVAAMLDNIKRRSAAQADGAEAGAPAQLVAAGSVSNLSDHASSTTRESKPEGGKAAL